MKWLVVTVMILLVVSLTLLTTRKSEEVLGILGAFSGSSASAGIETLRGVRMFLEGKDVKLAAVDDSWNPSKTLQAYSLLKELGVKYVILATTSSCLGEIYGRLRKDGILGMATTATSPSFSSKGDGLVRNVPPTDFEQEKIARFLLKRGARTVLVIRDTSNPVYTLRAMEEFRKSFSGSVKTLEVDFTGENVRAEVIRGYERADYVYIISGLSGEAGYVVQIVKSLDPSARVILSPWSRGEGLKTAAGNYLKGVIATSYVPFEPKNALANLWREYERRYKEEPSVYTVLGYEMVQILWKARQSFGKDPKAIERGVQGWKLETVLGEIEFDENGDVMRKMFFGVYTDEGWKEVGEE